MKYKTNAFDKKRTSCHGIDFSRLITTHCKNHYSEKKQCSVVNQQADTLYYRGNNITQAYLFRYAKHSLYHVGWDLLSQYIRMALFVASCAKLRGLLSNNRAVPPANSTDILILSNCGRIKTNCSSWKSTMHIAQPHTCNVSPVHHSYQSQQKKKQWWLYNEWKIKGKAEYWNS